MRKITLRTGAPSVFAFDMSPDFSSQSQPLLFLENQSQEAVQPHPCPFEQKSRNERAYPFKFRAFWFLASGQQSTAKVFFGAISPRLASEGVAFVRAAAGSKKAGRFPPQQQGNPAVSEMQELKKRDPRLSVPVSRQVWLFQSSNIIK